MTNPLYDALFSQHATNTAPFLLSDDGSVLTFAHFVKRAAQIAHVLRDAGVGEGDRVVVQAPKCAEAIALYAATLQAGAVYLPLNTAYTKAELSYFIGDATPALIVCDPSHEDALGEIAAHTNAALLTLSETEGSLRQGADAMPSEFETAQRGENDLAALLYTSGTTGRSKGAMLSHKNLLSNAQVLRDLWRITDQDRLIHALPIFHTHGLFVALNTALLAGTQVRLMGKFDAEEICAELPNSSLMMGVPTFYARLLNTDAFTRDLTKDMRLFISGSAPLLAETHTAFEDRTGHMILERYGMTETNMITSNPYEGTRRPGTVGYALPGTEVKITDPESGRSLDPGEIGVIEVRGNNVFQGYWNMPEKTAEELRDNGFFITGDLAMSDPDGRITIVGRAKDLIISGGYNIYPKEIEDVLNQVPGVLESAVFGTPDADFGERVVAAIVADGDHTPDVELLKSSVGTALASFKKPRSYVFRPALPRNAMGKVQKNILRDEFATSDT
ncbi:MAG: malonyl-CoA synthase [Pseudomonadota bacterium]